MNTRTYTSGIVVRYDPASSQQKIVQPKQGRRPGDAAQRAWAVVREATGQVTTESRAKDPAAVARGRKGGLARVKRLSPEQRSEDARRAVEARWEKKDSSADT